MATVDAIGDLTGLGKVEQLAALRRSMAAIPGRRDHAPTETVDASMFAPPQPTAPLVDERTLSGPVRLRTLRTIPTPMPLSELLPHGALARGTALSISGAGSERRMVEAWEVAAGMTWRRRASDHQGWAPIEAQAAQVIARLPDGIDTNTAIAMIDAVSNRCEYEIEHHMNGAAEPSPSTPDEPKTITQRQLVRLLRTDLTGAGIEGFMSSSARAREANRHFVPWLQEATAELGQPQSQERLNEIITRWRELRTQYFWHLSEKSDPTQVRVV